MMQTSIFDKVGPDPQGPPIYKESERHHYSPITECECEVL
jgi:hypothetical protein